MIVDHASYSDYPVAGRCFDRCGHCHDLDFGARTDCVWAVVVDWLLVWLLLVIVIVLRVFCLLLHWTLRWKDCVNGFWI
jgi:hypothetical protein